jgi:hypothetical protein
VTQWHFDTIIKLIQNGAPAIAPELCEAFAGLVNHYNELTAPKKEPEVSEKGED